MMVSQSPEIVQRGIAAVEKSIVIHAKDAMFFS